MNYSYTSNDPLQITIKTNNLDSLGIFIASILLSAGAFISQIVYQIQQSKCKKINCGSLECIREV